MLRRIVVTGGCGFIGSNFVHHVVREHPGVHVTVLGQAHLRRQPRQHRGAALRQGGARRGRHLRRRAGRPPRVRDGRRGSTTPPSPTTTTPSPTPRRSWRTNVRGTYTLIEACRKYGVRYHHVSTDEVYGDLELDDPARFTEETPYRPSSPYSSTKAALGHARARLGPHLRTCGHHLQLLQQLRPLPARGEVHPAGRSRTSSTACAPSSTATAATSATGSTPRTTTPPRPRLGAEEHRLPAERRHGDEEVAPEEPHGVLDGAFSFPE